MQLLQLYMQRAHTPHKKPTTSLITPLRVETKRPCAANKNRRKLNLTSFCAQCVFTEAAAA